MCFGIIIQIVIPELESMKDVYQRIKELLDELKKKYKDENILLVTHGGLRFFVK